MNFHPGSQATPGLPLTPANYGLPHDLLFSNISFDGTYMGWQGGCQSCVFEHIDSERYADLQDAQGGNVGGVGKWFAPPHLFYLNQATAGDPGLFNKNLQITDVTDHGVRVGVARDKGGTDTISGYALSLKIGAVDSTVDGYVTRRPDGAFDILMSDGLTISNVTASYDSKFLNDVFPGWRFPQSPYANLTFKDITLTDTAESSVQPPIASANQSSNDTIVMKNVKVSLKSWAGSGSLSPTIAGPTNSVSLSYDETSKNATLLASEERSVALTFRAAPSLPHAGDAIALTWTSTGATGCTASGDWSASIGASGTKSVTFAHAGNRSLTLTCKNATDTTTATIPIVVSP
jgi:hypothetical protein